MKIHLYFACWNEAHMLGFFFRHYDSWVDKYIVYEDGSTDDSVQILKEHPKVELRKFEYHTPGNIFDSLRVMENKVWKESKGEADWVIMVDVDEHLFVPGVPMREFLENYASKGITLVPALGYQMLSEDFPERDEHLCFTRTRGAPYTQMNKMTLFNPNAIDEINTGVGRHRAKPVGRLKFAKCDELLLLHYKYLGFENTVKRHKILYARNNEVRSRFGLTSKCGIPRYSYTPEQLREDWDDFEKLAVDISQPGFQAWKNHLERLWWWGSNPDRHWWTDLDRRIYRKFAHLKKIMAR
jgi:hypothetical protein